MPAEVAKATSLLSEKDLRVIYPNRQTGVLKPKASVFCRRNQTTSFQHYGQRLNVVPSMSGNAVRVFSWDAPTRSFFPWGRDIKSKWELEFGREPGYVSQVFGEPAALDIEYLGHYDRDVLSRLMEQQEQEYNMFRTANFEPNKLWESTIIATSPVLETFLYGLDDSPKNPRKASTGFQGKVMLYAHLGQSRRGGQSVRPQLKLSAATIANEDGLMRVAESYRWGEGAELAETKKGEVVANLARIMVFSQMLSENPTDRAFEWHQTGFPLPLVECFNILLRQGGKDFEAPGGRSSFLKENYGIDWGETTRRLPEKLVITALEKISKAVDSLVPSTTESFGQGF